jgi:hypothetical protein
MESTLLRKRGNGFDGCSCLMFAALRVVARLRVIVVVIRAKSKFYDLKFCLPANLQLIPEGLHVYRIVQTIYFERPGEVVEYFLSFLIFTHIQPR